MAAVKLAKKSDLTALEGSVERDRVRPAARRAVIYNEVRNPRAANDLTGFVASAGTLTRRTDDGVSAQTCFQIDHTTEAGVATATPRATHGFAVREGQVVTVRARVKPLTAPAGGGLAIYVGFYQTNGTTHIETHLVAGRVASDIGIGTWGELEGFMTAPAAAAYVVITVTGIGAGTWSLRATDLCLAVDPADGVPGYTAGDQENAKWLGTAHASRSVGAVEMAPSADLIVGSHGLAAVQGVMVQKQQARLEHELGVTHSRFAIPLADLEPTQGDVDMTVYDELFDEYRDLGIKVILLAGGGAYWMTPSVSQATFLAGVYPPDASFRDEYNTRILAIIDRYSDVIEAVEGWNEPNLVSFWTGGANVANYYAFLASLHDAVKADFPNLPVLGGSLWPGITTGSGCIAYDEFITGMYDAGARKWDALSIHVYPQGATTGTPATGNDATVLTGWRQMLEEIRIALAAKGDSGRALWITECGMSTTQPTGPLISEQRQAIAARQLIHMADHESQVAAIVFHTLTANANDGAVGVGFELFRSPGLQPKPAAKAIREVMRPSIAGKALHQWRRIGDTGEPAFGANWSNTNAVSRAVAQYRLVNGEVQVRADIKRPVTATPGEVMFTLPSGHRPPELVTLPAMSNYAGAGGVQVGPSGDVQWLYGTPTVSFTFEFSLPVGGS